MAAHIAAAAPGGPRYDSGQTPEERSSRENGVWLCATHAEGIDDEERYTVALLAAWRETAEAFARAEQGRPEPDAPDAKRHLVPHGTRIGAGEDTHRGIQGFLEDVGADRCWGRQYQLARMILTELALNAFEHGRVEQVEIEAREGEVTLRETGEAFGIEELRRGGNGGYRALADLEAHARGAFTLRYRRADDRNEWTLVDEVVTAGTNVPCSMSLERTRRNTIGEIAQRELDRLKGCEELHLYHPSHWTYSDWIRLILVLGPKAGTKRLVIHGLIADEPLAEMIAEKIPGAVFPD